MPNCDPVWQEIITRGTLGKLPVTYLAETTSTNEVAMDAAKKGAETWSLFLAETQSSGRGRLGKSWQSPPGTGLYFSMILRPRLDAADLPQITLSAGLAACLAVQKVTGLDPQIKWPNDLLLNGKKFAGILTETESLTEHEKPVVILGLGMNVNTEVEMFPLEIQDHTTSIKTILGKDISRGELLRELSQLIIDTIKRLEREGFSKILEEWKTHDATLGKKLQWVTQNGKIITGISQGPDDDGLLRIKDKEGRVHEVISGDINLAF